MCMGSPFGRPFRSSEESCDVVDEMAVCEQTSLRESIVIITFATTILGASPAMF